MIYGLLADLVILLHFLWILFLVFGLIFALKKPRIAVFHGAGLLFSLLLNIMGWYCPLTYLENHFHALHDPGSAYMGPFVAKYVQDLVYPDLPEKIIRVGEIIFVSLYMIGYAYLAKKTHILDRIFRYRT
ncbi:MAG: DUF2784 domain-containing protein [Desulfobacteraceae bacterium]